MDGLSGLFSAAAGAGGAVPPHAAKTPGVHVLTSAWLQDVSRALNTAVDGLQAKGQGKVILVIDQLDFLLAATAEDEVTGTALRDMVLDLREVGITRRHVGCQMS